MRSTSTVRILCAAIASMYCVPAAQSVALETPPHMVRVCSHPRGTEAESDIFVDLARLALNKIGMNYQIEFGPIHMSQARKVLMMRQGGDVCNLIWAGSAPEYEDELLPVRVPLFRGLLGYRVSYIRKERQGDFDKVKTIEDLAKFKALMGSDWIDVRIFEAAGLPVVGGLYDRLGQMLATGRGDYYPRGILEVNVNPSETPHTELAIEHGLLLHYPLAMFYFVSPSDSVLRDALRDGLNKAMLDGSYFELLANHVQTRDVFLNLRLDRRRLLGFDNPTMTAQTREVLFKYYTGPEEFARRMAAARHNRQ